jgi:cytochrome c2
MLRPALAEALLLLALGCSNAGLEQRARNLTGGDPHRGKEQIQQHGCAACHTIPGIPGASALIGPSLAQVGSRNFIGGVLDNTPANLVRWLKDPPGVSPRTAMPNLRLDDAEARDIASYLYTLQ